MNQFEPGDFVKIIGQDTIAEVVSDKGKELEVALGAMKMTVKKNRVEPAKAPEKILSGNENSFTSSGIDTKEKLMHFQYELDVRGKMKDEVFTTLESWTDDAILLGVKEAKIIHGRGTGVIKDTVRAFLKKYKEVESLSGDPADKSGDYMTIVKFKED